MEYKIKALAVLARYLNRTMRSIGLASHVGIAGGDHILIVDGHLYRVDLCIERVRKV